VNATPIDWTDFRFRVFRDHQVRYANHPGIQQIAYRLASIGTAGLFDTAAAELPSLEARRCVMAGRLLQGVQSRVAFVREAGFHNPADTWNRGLGDCKSSATLLAALALSCGCQARLMAMGFRGDPKHVCCQLAPWPGAPWLWAETTIPGALLGEHPSDALARLQPDKLRGDLLAHAPGFQAVQGLSLADLTLGTLPDVPGLKEREAKEPGFIKALLQVCSDTQATPDKVAALMSEESGFNPSAVNPVSGSVGLLQWMPIFAPADTGHTASELAAMSATAQLDAVRKTFAVYEKHWGPEWRTDPVMAGWGSHVGEPDESIVANMGSVEYAQNAGYDRAHKGYITCGDVRSAVYDRLEPAKQKPRLSPDGTPSRFPWWLLALFGVGVFAAGAYYFPIRGRPVHSNPEPENVPLDMMQPEEEDFL
jgi:hypothetical protein